MHDDARCSYAYVLRARDDGGDAHFSAEQLRGWFEALHPRRFEDAGDDGAAWTKVKRCGDSCLFLQFDFLGYFLVDHSGGSCISLQFDFLFLYFLVDHRHTTAARNCSAARRGRYSTRPATAR